MILMKWQYSVLICLYVCLTTASVPHLTMLGGYEIPSLGYGTFTVLNETELTIALNEALKVGYRHIDTAAFYYNEHIIGKVLKEWLISGRVKREDLFITTKLHLADEFPDKVESGMKKALENLQLDYVDLFLIHCPVAMEATEDGGWKTAPTDLVGVWKKMEEQVDAGRTKTIGVSNFNISQMNRIMDAARIQPANLQIEIHPYYQQKEMRDYCKQKNIVVVAYSSFGAPGLNTFMKLLGRDEIKLPAILDNPVIARIAAKHKKTTAQVILRFIIQLDLVVIPKSTNLKRIKENFDIFDFKLDDHDMKEMEKLEQGIKAKVIDLKFLTPDIINHPEYPFKELL